MVQGLIWWESAGDRKPGRYKSSWGSQVGAEKTWAIGLLRGMYLQLPVLGLEPD